MKVVRGLGVGIHRSPEHLLGLLKVLLFACKSPGECAHSRLLSELNYRGSRNIGMGVGQRTGVGCDRIVRKLVDCLKQSLFVLGGRAFGPGSDFLP